MAAASHTGAIAGDDTLYSAAFRRAGVVRVDEIEDLFDASEALSRVSSPRGPRLGIVTNAGGPGVMAVRPPARPRRRARRAHPRDRRQAQGVPAVVRRARQPRRRRRRRRRRALRRRRRGAHGRPQLRRRPGHPHAAGDELPHRDRPGPGRRRAQRTRASRCSPRFMGEIKVPTASACCAQRPRADVRHARGRGRAPTCTCTSTPRAWRRSTRRRPTSCPTSTPTATGQEASSSRSPAQERSTLTEVEAKEVLEAYDIPVVKTVVATTPEECARAAERDRLPGGDQDLSATTSPTRPTSAASRSTCARRPRPPSSSPRSPSACTRRRPKAKLLGVDRAGDVARRLRGHHRLQRGRHLRPGAHVRHGRHRRRALPRRGGRLPAAQPGAGAHDDQRHQGLAAAARLSRRHRRRHGRARADAGEVQLPAGRLPRDPRDGRQPAAGARRRPRAPSTRASSSSPRTCARSPCRART